ncbi:MAG: hypothetical protein ACTHZ9_11285 [Leucobacter sp.]
MSTDIVHLEANNLKAWMENARVLSDASLLPREYQQQPANILLAIQTGAPLGFGTLESINGIHIINGKPTMSADLVQASIRRAGHRLRITGDDTYAEAVLIRADDPDFEFKARWDMNKAKTAGLLSNETWKKYPAAMLRSRAITEVARMGAADALHGVIYTPEELDVPVNAQGEPLEAEFAPADPAPAAPAPAAAPEPLILEDADKWRHAIDTSENEGQLGNLWERAKKEQLLGHHFEDGPRLGQYLLHARDRFQQEGTN